tara:strand:- start:494 stop:634 length:141 start_codon:yes stop_codon:yes gene_type:complete
MIKIIEEAIKNVADMQLNLQSQAAQEFLAKQIETAILKEIENHVKK